MPNYESEDVALKRLLHDFPDVSARILAAILSAYLTRTKTVTDAIDAAHDRIVDACAL